MKVLQKYYRDAMRVIDCFDRRDRWLQWRDAAGIVLAQPVSLGPPALDGKVATADNQKLTVARTT